LAAFAGSVIVATTQFHGCPTRAASLASNLCSSESNPRLSASPLAAAGPDGVSSRSQLAPNSSL
jgi:hypothetical protein